MCHLVLLEAYVVHIVGDSEGQIQDGGGGGGGANSTPKILPSFFNY